ncbi:MAG: transcriptional regulator, GntR family [Acidobacteria bacterium]|nr:transcriptional regulator, GntR family [Acidobacteriota bacterium]
MELHVHLEGRDELARQIYQQLRAAILSGRVARGEKLPPTRELARRLAVSRNTVSLAYEWLVAEGLLSGRSGAGSFVESDPVARASRPRAGVPIRHRAVWDSIDAPPLREQAPRYDFGVGMPDAALFPYETWRRLLARQIRASKLNAEYGDAAGHPKLRAGIARYVAVSRGVNASADDVIVTNGAQQAFDLIARVLLEPGMRVAVEEPGYPPPRQLFASLGARVAAIAVDDEGLDVDALPNDTRLVYVTPSHQFPLGLPMSPARRAALLAWAERRNAVIVEDDYDSEFRFGGRPLETLQAMDRAGRVIYVGSFSKSLLPSLRLGFLIAPPSLLAPLRAASYVAGWYAQWPAQLALASFIDEGLLARHVRKMRRVYAERHDRILQTLLTDFAKWLTPVPSVTGMHLAARLRRGGIRLERELAERAFANGVGFDRLSAYCTTGRGQPGLVLGYGAIATSRIDEGLRRLRDCF